VKPNDELNGSCLCGAIRFTVTGELGQTLNCHCSICRKAHSSAFRTRSAVRSDQLAWTAGAELIGRYESSPTTVRCFCTRCGTRLHSEYRDHPGLFGVPLGLFDGDPGVRPEAHIFVGSKADWYEITDDLPQYQEFPPWMGPQPD
jgi:hypothetical protein